MSVDPNMHVEFKSASIGLKQNGEQEASNFKTSSTKTFFPMPKFVS